MCENCTNIKDKVYYTVNVVLKYYNIFGGIYESSYFKSV